VTKLTRDQEGQLTRVAAAANRLDGAKQGLRDVALDAVTAGVPQTRVAEAADVGRMTLWRWLNEDAGAGQ
jgi:O-acetyl-ADP-ribose deacetylase (regulator of RNase III)